MLHGCRFVESNEAKIWKEGETAVYATLFLGKDAFGILDPEGEGMEMIIKPREVAGGPLNQFSTIGYKFCHGCKILYQERMLRVESGSSYGSLDEAN
jgi:N4-gp56 family major capsid protein